MIRRPEVPADMRPLPIRRFTHEPSGGGVFSYFGDASPSLSPVSSTSVAPPSSAQSVLAAQPAGPMVPMTPMAPAPSQLAIGTSAMSTGAMVWSVLSTISVGLSAYHGYKRNQNGKHPIAYAALWGVLGGIFPVVTPAVAFAEGFGKPERG